METQIVRLALDPEFKRKLKGYLTITLNGESKITPPAFECLPPDQRPVFVFQGLNSKGQLAVSLAPNSEEAVLASVRYGLKRIENGEPTNLVMLVDGKGLAAQAWLETLETKLLLWMSNTVMGLTDLSEGEKAGLEPLPVSSTAPLSNPA